jgi:hypothetical protein
VKHWNRSGFIAATLYVKDIVKHGTKNPIYVFPEMKLRGFIPNSYNHVSVSNLYIPRVGLPIWLQQNRQTDLGNIEIADRYMNVELGDVTL